jgi:putative hemolysin
MAAAERMSLRLCVVAVTIGLAGPASAVIAQAGEYHVYSCRTPSGEIAPADGWSGSETGTAALAEDTCSQPGGALIAGLRADTARTANSSDATWAFTAPKGETISAATLWRAGDAEGGGAINASYQFWLAGPTEQDPFSECAYLSGCMTEEGDTAQPLSSANRVVAPGSSLGTHLYASASCGGVSKYNCPSGSGDPNGYAAVIYLYAADLTLEQTAPPTAANVSGELTSASTVTGTSDIAFDASDPGSGVYEAVFSVDGQVVQSTVLNEDGGRCRNVGQTSDGLAAFLYVQPCPASVSADVGFDSTRVANGVHHLVVSVMDAAGNTATVLDRTITVANAPPPGGPNGTNASPQATLAVSWAARRSTHLTIAYGRAETVVGRLTAAGGVPIGAARVNVLATPAYAGASTAAVVSVSTNAAGAFTMRVPAGTSSRTLRFEYSDDVDSPPVVTRTLTLSVRAGVVLRVSPRTTSVGRSIHFSGRLLGAPIPRGGKLLVLEARSPGGAWLEFDVIRSDARGRLHASYRFKFPGPAQYQFRVVCEAEADYPFATGASNVVGVFEH